jgi:hypothetical protein
LKLSPANEDAMNLGLPPLELEICIGSVIATKTTTYPGWTRSIANKAMLINYC